MQNIAHASPLGEIEEHSLTHDVPISPMTSHGDSLLHPGPGHIKLNMARCLLKFLGHPLVSSIAKMLGFKTPRVQKVPVVRHVDHHQSHQILSVLLKALAYELLVPYVQFKRSRSRPTLQDYMTWVNTQVNDPTYMYVWHVTFTFLLAFHLYTESTRKKQPP